MEEQMKPGDYTALETINIRSQMNTKSLSNIVGGYTGGVPFMVYQVYDEKDGIVWGRVSSNTGDGTSRYVGLRVANHVKARMEKAFEVGGDSDLAVALRSLAVETNLLAMAVRDLVNKPSGKV